MARFDKCGRWPGARESNTVPVQHFDADPRASWCFRYAGRNRIEDGLGISVNFFHLDCLASEVRLQR